MSVMPERKAAGKPIAMGSLGVEIRSLGGGVVRRSFALFVLVEELRWSLVIG